MDVAIVCKLADVLWVDLKLLPAYCVFRSIVRDVWFGCLYAAGAERVEEAVFA